MIGSSILLLLVFSFLLIKSADLVIVALRRISKQTKTGVFALSAIILALGTSFPELFVGITSAIKGTPNLTLGVVIGSNIANIALVAGLTGLVVGRVRVQSNFLKKDVIIALIAGLLPMILILDKKLDQIDGLILLLIYGAYASSFFKGRFEEIAQEHKKEGFFYRFLRRFNHFDTGKTKEYGRLFMGVAFLLFSADTIVKISTQMALLAKIPVFVIGLIIVAVGTSLPEFVFSLRSLEEHQPSMFFGNLLGSTIANSTLIIGITSIIHPVEVVAINQYLIAAIAFIVIFGCFWYFIRTKHRLDRWEAALLLLLYMVFLVVEFI